MGSNNGALQDLTNRLTDRATAYEMEVGTEKSKIMTNSMIDISTDISMNGQKLNDVTSLKYLGATLCKVVIPRQQYLALQHHQLPKQLQFAQVSCYLHPPLWL